MATMDERLDKIDAAIAELRSEMNARLDRVDRYYAEFKTEVIRRFEYSDAKIDALYSMVHAHDVMASGFTKATLDFGKVVDTLMKSDQRSY